MELPEEHWVITLEIRSQEANVQLAPTGHNYTLRQKARLAGKSPKFHGCLTGKLRNNIELNGEISSSCLITESSLGTYGGIVHSAISPNMAVSQNPGTVGESQQGVMNVPRKGLESVFWSFSPMSPWSPWNAWFKSMKNPLFKRVAYAWWFLITPRTFPWYRSFSSSNPMTIRSPMGSMEIHGNPQIFLFFSYVFLCFSLGEIGNPHLFGES